MTHFICLILISSLTLVWSGCGSIYNRPGATLPTDPCELLKLRVEEAQRAEKAVQQAESRLHSATGHPAATDLDRMEAANFEFARRIASIHDAAPFCKENEKFAAETERLEQQQKAFVKALQSLR